MELTSFAPTNLNLKINCSIELTESKLASCFMLKGDLQKIKKLKEPLKKSRQKDLWNSTCFEWFIKPQGANHYWEFNLSPQAEWNLYHLDNYRQGLKIEDSAHLLFFERKIVSDHEIQFHSVIEINKFENFNKLKNFKMNICAVIEDTSNKKSYWSLIHKQSQPDFHHPDHFIYQVQYQEKK